jgi:thiol:disulfide interchange protein
MKSTGVRLLFLLLSVLIAATGALADTGTVQRDHIQAELVARVTSVQPGTSLQVGLRLLPDPGWHTYWRNPGDSGLPTEIAWDLPAGASASDIAWPFPGAMPMAHLINYGYEGEHLLPVTINVPNHLAAGDDFVIRAEAGWLVCEEICIPGDASLQLTLPVLDEPPSENISTQALFAWADQRQPQPVDWPAHFSTDGGQLSIQIEPSDIENQTDWAFFSALENLVDHAEPASVASGTGQILVAQKLSTFMTGTPETIPFVLVDTDNQRAFELSAQAGELVNAGALSSVSGPGWLVALGLALIGGVLLNLMPCVFPVLSIKAMSLVSGAGHDQRAHGLAYTAGVVLSFALLAGVLLVLRASGQAIGWGFQLQSPLVIGILIYVLFALGLSLSGLFDFGTRLMGLGQGLAEKGGLSGSFFTGILACVVASPCAAPFMGTALGVAILVPWPMAMAIFLALGLGLALPMLLLSFSPALARRMPRPGPWMETFKQAMAFPLYLAVVWLLWVLARQTDANGLAAVLIGMVVLAFALWLGSRSSRSTTVEAIRHATVGLSLIVVVAALGTAARFQDIDGQPAANAWWETYSSERLTELRNDPDRAVLVNMTADWCVTCLVNEGVALNTEAVRQAMADNDVVYVKGDWTRRDPAITAYLSDYGRNGVPLYVLYPANGDSPRVLPQILTPGVVVQALERL